MAQQGRVTRARRWWTSTPLLIRRFSISLILLGVALVGVGLRLDYTNWWDGHGFLVNLVSSLTSLCFGVPTALLVLSHLGNAQTDARHTRRAREFASQEIHEFQQVLVTAFRVNDITELSDRVRSLQLELRELGRQPNPERAEATNLFLSGFYALARNAGGPPAGGTSLPHAWAGVGSIGRQWGRVRTWQVQVQSQWRLLSEEVRPRVIDCGLPWVARALTTEAEQAARVFLSEDRRNPWRLPANARDSVGITAMGHFLGDLQALCATSEALAALYPEPETGQRR
ncbi:hypothetical protein ABZS79_35030 [Streptomyces griseoloalbus]|uniref:hypothetical protein n=1 Tax=Streptomyces griseoloalbus TaxID=67303 RepID=UPI0033B8F81B